MERGGGSRVGRGRRARRGGGENPLHSFLRSAIWVWEGWDELGWVGWVICMGDMGDIGMI